MKRTISIFILFLAVTIGLFSQEALTVEPDGTVKILISGDLKTLTDYLNPVGSVQPYLGSADVDGWLICDGRAVSRFGTYSDLFAIIGDQYGAGDGSTTFNLPDLRGMFLRGAGAHSSMQKATGSAYDGGAVGDFNEDQFQGHWHTAYGNNNAGSNGLRGADTGTFYKSYSSSVRDAIADGVNGPPVPMTRQPRQVCR